MLMHPTAARIPNGTQFANHMTVGEDAPFKSELAQLVGFSLIQPLTSKPIQSTGNVNIPMALVSWL